MSRSPCTSVVATIRASGMRKVATNPSPRGCSAACRWTDSCWNTTQSERAPSSRCAMSLTDKTVVLGLVSTKDPTMESQDDLLRRIDEASRYVPIERLALSPQCGFASTAAGNLLSEDEQWRKLEFVVDTARKVW